MKILVDVAGGGTLRCRNFNLRLDAETPRIFTSNAMSLESFCGLADGSTDLLAIRKRCFVFGLSAPGVMPVRDGRSVSPLEMTEENALAAGIQARLSR